MVIRIVLMFLMFFAFAFMFGWAVFRTNFFSKRRVLEITKTGTLVFISIVIAVIGVAVIMSAEKLI